MPCRQHRRVRAADVAHTRRDRRGTPARRPRSPLPAWLAPRLRRQVPQAAQQTATPPPHRPTRRRSDAGRRLSSTRRAPAASPCRTQHQVVGFADGRANGPPRHRLGRGKPAYRRSRRTRPGCRADGSCRHGGRSDANIVDLGRRRLGKATGTDPVTATVGQRSALQLCSASRHRPAPD